MLKKAKYLKYFLLLFFVYLIFAGRFDFYYPTTKTNYFILLADAFLHGQTNLRIIPSGPLDDLTIFNNKAYLYWPPLPSILMIPLVLVLGISISDILILAIIASFVPLLMYFVLLELKKINYIKINNKSALLLSFFLAFGTCFFSIAILGTVWFTSQVVEILIFLLALLFIIRFSRTNKNSDFIIGNIAFAAIIWARIVLILSFPIFIYFLFKKKKVYLFSFILTLFISVVLIGFYNRVRFNSFSETGIRYNVMNLHFKNNFQKFGTFNIRYLPHNFFYTFLNPLALQPYFPYIDPNPEGNSIFFTSPLFFILLTPLFKKVKIKRKTSIFLRVLLGSVLLTIFPVLLNFGSGWFQFGSRYLLEVVPLAIILLAIILPAVPKRLFFALLIISIIINSLGALWLLALAPSLYF